MKLRDFALLELDVRLGDLKQRGITAYKLEGSAVSIGDSVAVIGAPLFSPDQLDYLRSDTCKIVGQTDVLEWFWYWTGAVISDCTNIHEGSSGSPMITQNGRVMGVINTSTAHVQESEVCYLGHPCEVNDTGKQFVADRSYGSLLFGLDRCFVRGAFKPYEEECMLDTGSRINLERASYTPTRGDSTPFADAVWDINLGGLNQGFIYKTGPVGKTNCFTSEGYSNLMPANSSVLQDLPLPQNEGSYVTCVAFEELQKVRAGRFPMVIPVTIDQTGPEEEPVVTVLNREMNGLWVEPIFSVPELAGYFYSEIGMGESCEDAEYSLYRRIPLVIELDQLPLRFCLLTEDNANNFGMGWEFTIDTPPQSDLRYELRPNKVFAPSMDLLDQVKWR